MPGIKYISVVRLYAISSDGDHLLIETLQKSKSRLKQQVRRGWNLRLQYLIAEPACHSEEEDAADGKTFHVLSMPRRSLKATNFIHALDGEVEEFITLTKKYNAYKKYPRQPHPTNKVTQLNGLPSPRVALDWHDPMQFNRLPAFIRAKYIRSPIALPLQTVLNQGEDWQSLTMSDEEFMQKYGNNVRALYQFPTKEQIEAMKNGVLPESDSSDEVDEEDDEGFADSGNDEGAEEPNSEDFYDDNNDYEEEENESDVNDGEEREEGMEADNESTGGEELAAGDDITENDETNESQSTATPGGEGPINPDSEMEFESAVESNEDTEMESDDDL